jgi:hypothetical protein
VGIEDEILFACYRHPLQFSIVRIEIIILNRFRCLGFWMNVCSLALSWFGHIQRAKRVKNLRNEPSIMIFFQGLVLVYVTVIMVMVVRQFSNLSTIEEDQKRLLVVDRVGNTEVETLRTVMEDSRNLV